MRLTLTTDDGVLLDQCVVTRKAWDQANANPRAAHAILTCLHAGIEREEDVRAEGGTHEQE